MGREQCRPDNLCQPNGEFWSKLPIGVLCSIGMLSIWISFWPDTGTAKGCQLISLLVASQFFLEQATQKQHRSIL
jgi:hypothetical protein